MGCGKSKHDVASGNTVLQRKKSTVNSKENNETQTVDKNNDANVDNVSLEVEEKNKENVKEIGVEGKGGDESNDVAGITKVQQEDKALEKSAQAEAEENEAPEVVVAEGPNDESQLDVSIKEETLPLVKEEESKDTDEEALVKEEESIGTKEETLDKEEETKETTEQEKTLVKEGETKGAN
ncbi:uncharacterized protein [Glycine max]|uniref:uncharacterized protein n=1 Tax=Glycine max TaxID=3847 RepID=UPI0003DE859E|nr:uncharacterized protein LOC102664988 [Glycine max]KAG4932045.1 hypothetical protein JHK87_046047 [Glycine soja]|eukprot:XP_006601394.1 uncharacterized protein LOC102664988 [Glycine max]